MTEVYILRGITLNGYGEVEEEDFTDIAYRDKEKALRVLREEAKVYIREHKRLSGEKLLMTESSTNEVHSISVSSPKREYITYTAKVYYLE